MSGTLYVGVLVHEHGQDTVISGYDYASVVEATKQAYITHLDEVWGISADEAEDYPLPHTHDIVVTATIPPAPKSEPKWFTEAKDLYSPSDMANDMIESFDMSTLYEVLKESLNSPEAYINVLQDGHIGQFCELETHLAGARAYDDEFLQELSEHSGRPAEQYKNDSNLVVLDYLRWETQER